MNAKKMLSWVIPLILIIIILSVGSSALYTVQENEYALVVRFSKVIDTVGTPGLHFKIPMIDDIKTFPKMKIFYDIPPSDVLTSDAKSMSVDSFVIWKITDPFLYNQTLQGSKSNAESRLDASTYSALKKIIGTMPQSQIISSSDKSRDELNTAVLEQVKSAVVEYGIEVLDVKIKRFDLPPDNEQSVYRRMISDRNQIAESYKAEGIKEASIIRNEVDKTVNITVSDAQRDAEKIIAAGESEYMRIIAEAYNTPDKEEFYSFIRGLDALKSSLSGDNKTVILDKDSVLAQILIKP